MTCSSCEEKVTSSLLEVENITSVTVSKDTQLAISPHYSQQTMLWTNIIGYSLPLSKCWKVSIPNQK